LGKKKERLAGSGAEEKVKVRYEEKKVGKITWKKKESCDQHYLEASVTPLQNRDEGSLKKK